MIGHLGTFDVENYGDLLYPIVLRRLLTTEDVQQYSLLPGVEIEPIRSLFQHGYEAPRTLVIGGGDRL